MATKVLQRQAPSTPREWAQRYRRKQMLQGHPRMRYGAMANSLQAWIPELWARESLAILEENMVMGGLIHRDFENVIARLGETVHTRRPSEFVAKRKAKATNITIQDASTTNVDVVLNQHIHVSFDIDDSDNSKSFADLVNIYLRPAMLANARKCDRSLLGMYAQFIPNTGGRLGGLTTTNGIAYMLDLKRVLSDNKCYEDGRNLIHNTVTESLLLNLQDFRNAEKVGDGGLALREASMGRRLGFNNYTCQNMANVLPPVSTLLRTGNVNLSAGYVAGTTSAIVVNNFTGAVSNGEWLIIDGQINRVSAHTETLGNTTGITLVYPLAYTVANAAPIIVYTKGTVNATYLSGDIADPIVIATATLNVGQFFSIQNHTTPYAVTSKDDATHVGLDRPLDAAVTSGDELYPGPAGLYSFAFHRNAIAMVNRPFALIPNERMAVVSNGWMSMRVSISYDYNRQAQVVTLDSAVGYKKLDTNLGGLLLG